jgi:hypothetical protein
MQILFGQTSRRVRQFVTPLSTPRLQRIGGTLLGLAGSTLAGVIFGLALPVTPANAQVSSNRQDGLRDNTPRWHAITGARIVVAPGKVIENGTLVMRDGRITAVGADVVVPTGARVWKLDGRSIYAALKHFRVGDGAIGAGMAAIRDLGASPAWDGCGFWDTQPQ